MRTTIKGQSDPAWWIEQVLGIKPWPVQREIIDTFYRSRSDPTAPKYRNLYVLAGMRSGKTALGSMIGCYEFWDVIRLTDPAAHWGLLPHQEIFLSTCATSEQQAEDGMYSNMVSMLEESEFLNTWFDIRYKTEITCPDKRCTVRLLSSWSTTAVGRTNKFVLLDEISKFEETAGKRGAWEMFTSLKKSTDTLGPDGHTMAISSSKHPTDIIMTLYERGKTEPQSLSLMKPTWDMNPNLSFATLLEEHKHDIQSFWRDYGCQPQISSAMQFPEGVFLTDIPNVLKNLDSIQTTQFHVMAIDPAIKNDAFGIACGYIAPDGRIIVDGVTKLVKYSGDAFLQPGEIRTVLETIIQKLNVYAVVYDVYMFMEMLLDFQNKYGVQIERHVVKKLDYDKWRELQSRKEITVVQDPELKMEADQLMVFNEHNPRTDHPVTGSKDMSDSVANVIWWLKSHANLTLLPDALIIRALPARW